MLFIEVLIIVSVIAVVGYPLMRPSVNAEFIEEGDDYHKLLYERDTSYLAIKDLDFDFRTGKIGEDDYKKIKADFEEEAVTTLKKLDLYNKTPLENAEEIKVPKILTCANCGTELKKSDKFCSRCGIKAV